MKKVLQIFCLLFLINTAFYSQTTYNDSVGDIDPGLATGGGTLDIVKMEVSHTATDFIFKLTVDGNITTTDWGNFMIGIATGNTAGTPTGNGWGRPINLDGASADMNYWIGSWVNAGGGSQLWSYNNTTTVWDGPVALAGYSLTPAVDESTITYTVSHASIGITEPGTIYFDAYSSGGGGGDGAVDALANPAVTITTWGGSYTSDATSGLLSYNFGALPVELTSFTAKQTKAGVMLNWKTATEVNNYGFDVETLRATSSKWEKIGFVEGHGNSNSPKEYSFLDNSAKGSVSYRLKQVDFNGNFEYSDIVTVKASLAKTELYQNSPNPFNPNTKISFSLVETGKVNVSIYNIIGQKVAELVNQTMESGVHNVDFNASNLPSGLYIYRMDTPNYSKTMKMMLLK